MSNITCVYGYLPDVVVRRIDEVDDHHLEVLKGVCDPSGYDMLNPTPCLKAVVNIFVTLD